MVMTELRNNADFSKLPYDHPARAYKNIQNRLSIDRDESTTKNKNDNKKNERTRTDIQEEGSWCWID